MLAKTVIPANARDLGDFSEFTEPVEGFDMTNTLFEPLRDNSSFVSFVSHSLRSLRKFSSHCSYVAVLNEKIRPHHEVHEGHEGFRIFQTPNFVIFVSFVVNIFLSIWLRCSRARIFVVKASYRVLIMPFDAQAIFANLAEKEQIKGHHSPEGRAIRTLSRALSGWSSEKIFRPVDVIVLCDQAVEDWLKARLKRSPLVDSTRARACARRGRQSLDYANGRRSIA